MINDSEAQKTDVEHSKQDVQNSQGPEDTVISTDDAVSSNVKKERKDAHGNSVDVYDGIQQSTQLFRNIGLLEAVNGDILLRGRHGERDHIYPMDRAIRRFLHTHKMVTAMARHAIHGWDTLYDINRDMLTVIMEAIKQRMSLNLPLSDTAKTFYSKFSDKDDARRFVETSKV